LDEKLFEETATRIPPSLAAIESDTAALGFTMASDRPTGSLLRALAASRPGGRLLELGTGTGMATAWLLDGMDATATLLTVELDEENAAVARRHLGHDPRLTIRVGDGAASIASLQGQHHDLIFADTWPGKFDHLGETLNLLRIGGLYVIDDMLPQPNWPPGHETEVDRLIETLSARPDLQLAKVGWSTGIIIATRIR
jgi:predicted O-methyltransferase YrrM